MWWEILEAVQDQGREVALFFMGVRIIRTEGTRPPLFELWARLLLVLSEIYSWAWVGIWIVVVACVALMPILVVAVLFKLLFFGL